MSTKKTYMYNRDEFLNLKPKTNESKSGDGDDQIDGNLAFMEKNEMKENEMEENFASFNIKSEPRMPMKDDSSPNMDDKPTSSNYEGGFKNFQRKIEEHSAPKNFTETANVSLNKCENESPPKVSDSHRSHNEFKSFHRRINSMSLNERFTLLERGYVVVPIKKTDKPKPITVKFVSLDRHNYSSDRKIYEKSARFSSNE